MDGSRLVPLKVTEVPTVATEGEGLSQNGPVIMTAWMREGKDKVNKVKMRKVKAMIRCFILKCKVFLRKSKIYKTFNF